MEYGIEAKMSSKLPVTLIIADFSPRVSITDCLKNIDSWSPQKIVVSNNLKNKDLLSKYPSFQFVYCESKSIFQLWEIGIKESKTRWNLLITSNEVVTGRLKISIESQIKNNPNTEKLFKINKKVIFLKKVLKYPLEWVCEFPSSLVFIPEVGNFTLEAGLYNSSPFLEGELVHFSESSLNGNVQEVVRLSEIQADYIYNSHMTNNLVVLIFKSFLKSGIIFFRNWIFKKGFREGYEGIVFSIFGGIVPLLGLLRYCEKFLREGKVIANNLSEIKNILIIKLGGIGDVVLTTPVIRNFKKILPQVEIHVMVLNGVAPVLENNPHIKSTTLVDYDDKKSLKKIKKIASTLKSRNIDLAINLQSTNFSFKILKRLSSRWKINRSYFFRDKNTDVLVGITNTYRSIIERELDVLRSIGLVPTEKHTEVFLTAKEIDWARSFVSSHGFSHKKKIITVNPCSSLKIKNWGIENFSLLCKNLILEGDIQIIITCPLKEVDNIAPIKKLSPEVEVFSGSLRQVMGLINESDLFIGNDSGPAHISQALDIPTLTISGLATLSFIYDPGLAKEKHYAFNKEVYCRDLFQTQCMSSIDPVTNHPFCDTMTCLDLSVDEVAAKALDLLKVLDKKAL
jgi:heptosyltransferase III